MQRFKKQVVIKSTISNEQIKWLYANDCVVTRDS